MTNESSVLSFCPACFKDLLVAPTEAGKFRCPHCERDFCRADLRTTVPLPLAAIVLDSSGQPQSASPAEAEGAAAASKTESADTQFSLDGAAAPDVSKAAGPVFDTSAPRPRRRSVGIFGQLIGVVGGGVFGLALGYAILLKVRGPAFDPLGIADDVPTWMLPSSPLSDDDPAGSRREKPNRFTDERDRFPPFPGDEHRKPASDADDLSAPLEPGLHPKAFNELPIDKFEKKLSEAEQALACESCDGTGLTAAKGAGGKAPVGKDGALLSPPCSKCRGKGTKKLTPARYAVLCGAAHDSAVVKIGGADPSDVQRVADRAVQLMLTAASDFDDAQVIGRFAAGALAEKPRQESGIVLTGTVLSFGRAGKLYSTEIVLLGQPQPVTLISRRPGEGTFAIKDQIVVAGVIIDLPNIQLVDYEGEDRQVVFVGLPALLK